MVNGAIEFAIAYPYPQSKAGFRNQLRTIIEFDTLDEIASISSKTLVVCGEEDLLFPQRECIKLADAIPNAAFSAISNAAHSTHVENPKDFIECVIRFLSHD